MVYDNTNRYEAMPMNQLQPANTGNGAPNPLQYDIPPHMNSQHHNVHLTFAQMGNHIPKPILPVPQQYMTQQQPVDVNWFQPMNQASPPPGLACTAAAGGGGSGGGSDDGSSHSGSDRRRNDERRGIGIRKGGNDSNGNNGGGPPDDGPPDGDPWAEEEGSEWSENPKGTLGKHRGVTPFGEIQPEESPHYETEFFEYKPEAPQGQVNLKEQVFQMLATLIDWRLFTKYDTVSDAKTQKSLVNSIPKVRPYKGENSIITLDVFV
ncbi:hypothetical protein VKT23_016205 [Stygiomarasmius scandens]|uniref:Uncharacterized protein n=1 Tax=Marasmiellus scandens TaxID=2682957 RepID=A0ABR1IZZ1_9AGAR